MHLKILHFSSGLKIVTTSWERMRANKVTISERTDLTSCQETSNEQGLEN
jgi:hypothetical protein